MLFTQSTHASYRGQWSAIVETALSLLSVNSVGEKQSNSTNGLQLLFPMLWLGFCYIPLIGSYHKQGQHGAHDHHLRQDHHHCSRHHGDHQEWACLLFRPKSMMGEKLDEVSRVCICLFTIARYGQI